MVVTEKHGGRVVTELPHGTWEETRSYLNREFPSVAGADAVERGAIRRRLEVLEWDCPLHLDDDAARALGYDGIIAPATMVETFAIPPYWQPGDPSAQPGDPAALPPLVLREIPAPGRSMVATGMETEYLQPLYVGDTVHSVSKLVDVVMKRTRLGDGAFLTVETVFFNQRDERIAVGRMTVFRF